ncbi:uncharacterized protein LOC131027971 isoform X2 [Cryptomeria japonica]|uniref:uncharacterized protein LOC131027971 isoform X2 n=1 Tax=Cryptomeria japonica TaxID=3369 RepID=UPI0027D9E5C7|nr:uncharacterized protein LOC131027971 isoform X2 [Cryptomeria japonica]
MEMPECSICLQQYDEEEDRIPRVLSCGHSPCHSCLNELPRHWTDSNSSSSSSSCLIRCPECTQWVKLPLQGPSGLPKNIELLRLIQALQPKQERGKSKPKAHLSSNFKNTEFKPPKFNGGLDPHGPCTDWANWIIPEDAIRLETAVEEDNELLLIGFLTVGPNLKKQLIGLMPIGPHVTTSCSPPSPKTIKGNSYSERITGFLHSLVKPERLELQILMTHSLLNRKVCRVFGFWMSCEGIVYLVCEKLQRVKTISIHSALSELRSSTSGFSPTFDEVLNNLSKRAAEICEVVVSLHSQEMVCGCLAPECFEFDEFGHPLFSLNRALLLRTTVRELIRNAVSGGAQSSKTGDVQITASNAFWMYLSPEVLSILYQSEQGRISNEIQERTTHISLKADVWSFGCFLLMLLIGESPFKDLSFSEFFSAITIERIKIDAWLDDKLLLEPMFSSVDVSLRTQFEHFKHIICKCFEYEPENRPDAHDLWRSLSGWSTSSKQPFEDKPCCNASKLASFCLVLGESLSPLTTEIEYCGEQGAADGRLEMKANKLKDKCSNESKVVDAQGTNGGVLSANRESEYKMDDLEVITLKGHLDCVTALTVCGDFLLSASYDKTICIWSLHSYSHLQTLRGHEHRILALTINVEQSLCFSGDYGGCIFVWAIGTVPRQEPVITWYDHKDWRYSGVHSLAISKDGYLYSGSGDRTIKAWSLQMWKDDIHWKSLQVHDSAILALDCKDDWVFIGGWDKTIKAFNLNNIAEEFTPKVINCNSIVTSLLFHQGNLLVGFAEKFIKVTKFF